jgi:hypothetical protein
MTTSLRGGVSKSGRSSDLAKYSLRNASFYIDVLTRNSLSHHSTSWLLLLTTPQKRKQRIALFRKVEKDRLLSKISSTVSPGTLRTADQAEFPSLSLPSRPSRGRRSRAPLRHSLPHPAAPVQHQPQPRSAVRRRGAAAGLPHGAGRTGWPAPRALGGSRGCAPEDAKSALEFLSTTAILTEYDKEEGYVSAIAFRILLNNQPLEFRLPCDWKPVLTILERDRNVPRRLVYQGQAVRVA